MTIGFQDSDQYDNATLDNWVMTMGGRLACRVAGGFCEYDSNLAVANVTNVMGGLSPIASRTAEGLMTITLYPAFKSDCVAFPSSTSVNDQVFLYSSETTGLKVMTLEWDTDAFLLSDEPFVIYVEGR